MRIFIVGNINSGKTYFSKKLIKKYPNYAYLSIDEYRMKSGDGSLEKELEIRKLFANDILKIEDAIIEFSGGETITQYFIDDLKMNSFIMIEICENVQVCLEKIADKNFNQIPYPQFEEKIEDTIMRLDSEFKNKLIDKSFKDKYLKKYIINSSEDVNALPLEKYELLFQIINKLKIIYKNIISFGSLGRGDINKLSDIDLFLLTQNEFSVVVNDIKRLIKYDDILYLRNQIVLYIGDEMVEIIFINNIQEVREFYKKSEITNVKKTLLVGEHSLIPRLQYLLDNYIIDFDKELSSFVQRLQYFVKSLKKIERKQDSYKFYFHNNIIIHEYVKVKSFLNGNYKYSYLPKNSRDLLKEEEWNSLIYNFNDDMNKHIENVKKTVNQLLKEYNL